MSRLAPSSSFPIASFQISSCSNEAEHRGPLRFTALHELEVRNALRLGIFRRVITGEHAKAAMAAMDADLRDGRLVRVTVRWPATFRATLKLSEQHAETTGTRSLDILHIASAEALRIKAFATFDTRQQALAEAVGLTKIVAD
jgi:hypothetical protein